MAPDTAAERLDKVMEFDHVIEVHPDSSITDGPTGIYAPDLVDEQLSGGGWEFFSTGYTGQDRYHGPIMHNSEFIGGRLAQDILTTPGIYAAVVAYWTPQDDDEDDETTTEGWAVVRYTAATDTDQGGISTS